MPLVVEDKLPSKKILEKEDIFIMGKSRAKSQDIRPINIGILNLMPNKEETEIQLFRTLSNTPLQVNIDLIRTKSYKSKNTEEKYLEKFYKDFSEIKNKKYDGLIITGAPVEQMDFEEVIYWEELEEIFEYARSNVYSTMFICWASQAALYHYYNIPKYTLNKKIFGVYEYEVLENTPLTRGFDDIFYSPQSRYSYTKKEDVMKVEDLKIIGYREDTGVSLVTSQDNRFVFVAGHGEYERETLYKEYIRDLEKGLDTEKPVNYFRNNKKEDGIIVRWRSHGDLLFSNWLNYCVYQGTPYNISDITKKKVLKFGGSSLSDSSQFIKVKNIISSEENRSLVIVSAPGKRFKGDIKVTDLLIAYFECRCEKEKSRLFEIIKLRYHNIILDLNVDLSFKKKIDKSLEEIKTSQNRDFVLSRGEYLSALIMAEYLDFNFLDSKNIIFFNKYGNLDKKKTYKKIRKLINNEDKYVIPGFYGTGYNGEIKTFERGGSDITGSLIASALKTNIYENWTDVDGLMDKDPNKYEEAQLIKRLTYDDFLKISLNGDQIYHIDAIKPVMEDNIPINIRNTNNPLKEGTIIGNMEERK